MASGKRIPDSLRALQESHVITLDRVSRGVSSKLYAIVDLCAISNPDRWYGRLTQRAAAKNLFTGQPEASASKQAAWLLEISDDDATVRGDLLHLTVEEAMWSQGIIWLESKLDRPTVAARLARRMTARHPNGEALLRYYDARLLPTLWRVLADNDLSTFGAVGDAWWFLDADAGLQNIDLPDTSPDMEDPYTPPLTFTQTQVDELLRVSEWHQLIDFLCKRQRDSFLSKSRGDRLRFVRHHDTAARQHHVHEFADRLYYCELALENGDSFAKQPAWQAVWATMQSQPIRLKAAISANDVETQY